MRNHRHNFAVLVLGVERSKAMLTHHCDSLRVTHPIDTLLRQHQNHRCYVEVPVGSLDEQSQLIEQVIYFALDTLGVRHLDVRVLAADRESRSAHAHAQLL